MSLSRRDFGDERVTLSARGGIRQPTNPLVYSPELEEARHGDIAIAEFAIQRHGIRLEGEYGRMNIRSNVPQYDDVSFDGYYLTAGYFPDGSTSLSYNGKYAKFGKPTHQNNIWEFYTRYSVLDLRDHGEGNKASVAMVGANYYLNRHLHFQLQLYRSRVSDVSLARSLSAQDNNGKAVSARMSYRF